MSGWIPCSERLPEPYPNDDHYGDVLLYIPGKKGSETCVYTGSLMAVPGEGDPEGEGNFWGIPIEAYEWRVWDWSYLFGAPEPTHWMPMPEPPVKEGE